MFLLNVKNLCKPRIVMISRKTLDTGKDLKDTKNRTDTKDKGIDVIFHWGLYSVPAYDDMKSVKRRRMFNGSEWYLKRLSVEENSYRPLSGWKETQAFHKTKYASLDYYDFAKSFATDVKVITAKMDQWMKLCKSIGATTVILTAKHHDGYCLWPTKTAEHHSMIDLIALFKVAALSNGLQFGLYYSWSEFDVSCTKEYLDTIVVPQITELIAYKASNWFFDGDWSCTSIYSKTVMTRLVQAIKSSVPGATINDRIGLGKDKANLEFLGNATYRVYEDRAMPIKKPSVPWTHINTIGYSWGRNKQQQAGDYKSGTDLCTLYKQVLGLNGRFMINLGPDADGTLDPNELKALQEFNCL